MKHLKQSQKFDYFVWFDKGFLVLYKIANIKEMAIEIDGCEITYQGFAFSCLSI